MWTSLRESADLEKRILVWETTKAQKARNEAMEQERTRCETRLRECFEAATTARIEAIELLKSQQQSCYDALERQVTRLGEFDPAACASKIEEMERAHADLEKRFAEGEVDMNEQMSNVEEDLVNLMMRR